MKAVVFGGSGFLGSHVADVLSDNGLDVKVFDVIESRFLKDNQKMIVGDILDFEKVNSAIEGCDYVYHYAGIAGIEHAKEKPLETIKINVLGTTNILESSRINKVKRLVFASSIYVYSNLAPFYRSSKQSCELIIEDYQRTFGLNYSILRYGSLYGRRATESNFILKIIKQAIEKGKIVRDGDGQEIRDYIHVLDAAKCSYDILSKEFENQQIILTGTQSTKVKDLLTMIKEIFNNKIKIEYKPKTNDDHYEITPYSFRPKIAKKYVSSQYHDLGQGILDVIYDVYENSNTDKNLLDLREILEGGIKD